MAKRRGLGRGLDVLIPAGDTEEKDDKKTTSQNLSQDAVGAIKSETSAENEKGKDTENIVTMVRITKVEPDRKQPRKNFDKEKLEELANSIRSKGLLEPIIVQSMGDHYEIIAGERRWRACKIADLKEIPVIIKEYDELERVEISLIENIQREDLNPIEEAEAYRRLVDEFHLKQEELADRVSKNRSSIANSMRLLKLSKAVQTLVIEEKISMGHARALLAVEDMEIQKKLAEEIVDKKLSVRETEKLIRELTSKKKEKKVREKDPSLELIYRDLERKMNASLGMKVAIKNKGEKNGSVEISFDSQDDLEKLMDRLMR
jgi:ParB family transcriptional regulator, chromosome partitioning protein